jgi:hypothetical protein
LTISGAQPASSTASVSHTVRPMVERTGNDEVVAGGGTAGEELRPTSSGGLAAQLHGRKADCSACLTAGDRRKEGNFAALA